jgi:hypothetical protein
VARLGRRKPERFSVRALQSTVAQQLIRAKQPTTAPIDLWGAGGPVEVAVNAVPDPFYKSRICWSFVARGPFVRCLDPSTENPRAQSGLPWRNPDRHYVPEAYDASASRARSGS